VLKRFKYFVFLLITVFGAHAGVVFGQSGTLPRQSGALPDQLGVTFGQLGTLPDRSGSVPERSGNLSGHSARLPEADFEDQAGIGLPPRSRPKHNFYRVTVGVGESLGLQNLAPLAYGLFATYQVNHDAITGSIIGSTSNSRTPPRHTWNEFDLLYGYAFNGHDIGYFTLNAEQFTASFSAGIGIYTYETRYRFGRRFGEPAPLLDSTQQNTFDWGVGIPVQIQTSYAITQFLGLGFTLYGNFNKTQINYGGLFSVQVGWF